MYLLTTEKDTLEGALGELESQTLEALGEVEKQLARRIRSGDTAAISDRVKKLRRAFRRIAASDRPEILSRLRNRREGDELSELFHSRISRGLRRRLIKVLETEQPTPDRYLWVKIPKGPWPGSRDHLIKVNASKAQRRNRHWRAKLGWGRLEHITRIRAQLLADLRFLDLPWWPGLIWATAAWQHRKGLKPDGIIGPKTWRKLRLALGLPVSCAGYDPGERSASRTKTGILQKNVFPLKDDDGVMVVDFPVASSRHRDPAGLRAELADLVRHWAGREEYQLRILGYSDCIGSERNNRGLRRKRAQAVFDLLGPAQKRVKSVAAAPNGTYVNGPESTANESRRDRAINRGVLIKVKVQHDFDPDVHKPDFKVPVHPDKGTPDGPQKPGSPLQIPALGLKKKFTIAGKDVPIPGGWVIMRIEGVVEIEGQLRWKDPKSKIGFDLSSRKVDLEARLGDKFVKSSITGSIEGGKLSSVGVKLGTDSIDIGVKLNTDLRKPFSVELKPAQIFVGELELGDLVFVGKVRPVLVLNFRPTARAAVSAASTAAQTVRSGVSAVGRGLFLGGELGTATTVGVVSVGAGVALVSIAAVALGLYMLNLSHRDGRAWAAGYDFATGYADQLAILTDKDFSNELSAADKRLARSDWKGDFAEKAARWINDKDREALGSMHRIGRAAILQDYCAYASTYGTFAWLKLAQRLRREFGSTRAERSRRWAATMREQVRREKTVGIRLPPPK